MDDLTAKAEIMVAIRHMADVLPATWDTARSWDDCSDALGGLIVTVGGTLPPADLSTVLAAAAMCHRQGARLKKGGAA